MVPGGILPARRGAKGLGTVPKYPVITGPTSANVDENTTPVATFTADEPVTWSIFGGLDAAKFTISSGGALNFITAPDYEAPTDTNLDNVYEVTISAVNGEGNRTTRTILAYVMDVAVEIVPDPDFENVTLLLHGDAANGAQNNTFVDSSSNNFTVSRNGNTTQGSFGPYGTRWSNYFDGSGDYLTAPDIAPLQLGSSDFTVECWVNFSVVPGSGQGATLISKFDTGNTGYEIILYNNTLYCQAQSANIGLTSAWTPVAGRWYHLAWTRSGSTSRSFIDGVQVASTTAASGAISNLNQALQLGRRGDNSFYLNGYLSDVRVVKGAAAYTANFTPPTAPLTAITNTSLLTCQSNRFRDASLNNFEITRNGDVRVRPFSPYAPSTAYNASTSGGSMYFDGSGDYLSVPFNSSFVTGTGDFTVEAWVYPLSIGSPQTIMGMYDSGVPDAQWILLIHTDGRMRFITQAAGTYGNAGRIIAGQWNHVAASRVNGIVYQCVNGTIDAVAFNFNLNAGVGYPLSIGADNDGSSELFSGWISGARVIMGTGLYSGSSYTPPTAPPAPAANTQLILRGANAGIFDSAGDTNFETVGNVSVSTAVKKFGTGSIYFDGSGDYLTAPPSDLYAFGTGDFTVECWFKSSVASQNTHATIVGCYQSSVNGTWAFKFFSNTNNISFASYTNNTWYDWNTTINPVSDQAWHHLAATRQNGTLRIFVDGALASSWLNVTNNLTGAGHPLTVGWIQQDAGTFLTGYVDELRITKGVARYTGSFTPPIAPFPDQ